MSGLKLVEIGEQASSSFAHLQKFLKNKSVDVELSQTLPEHAKDFLREKQAKTFDLLRLSYEMSQILLENWKTQPTQVQLLGCCDTFLFENKNYWPRVLLYESLREAIVLRLSNHDIKEAAYVVCNDMKGRVLVSLLLSLGHRRVFLVGEDEDFINEETEFLKRFHLGTEVLPLPAHQLTLQTTKASILVSTVKYNEDHPILNDLVYFNFMKSGGTVLDLNFEKSKSSLLEEAQRASLQTIPITYLSSFYDFSLIKKLGLKPNFPFEEFEQSWTRFLSERGQNSP